MLLMQTTLSEKVDIHLTNSQIQPMNLKLWKLLSFVKHYFVPEKTLIFV